MHNEDKDKIALLQDTLNRIIQLVQWAEIKHGTFLAINATALFGWGSMIQEDMWKNKDKMIIVLGILTVVLLLAAIIVSIISFYPRLSTSNRDRKNLMFFDDYATSSADTYLHHFDETNEIPLMYAEEIVINSEIAHDKYRLFKISLWCSIIAYVMFAITVARLFFL